MKREICSVVAAWAMMAHNKAGAVSFTRDVAPIVFQKCASCHREGQFAPFSLLTYGDLKKRGKQIAEVTTKRTMPPWLPESEPGEFLGDQRLTDAQIGVFQKWLSEGSPEGSPSDLPAVPQWKEGWQLGEPDLVVAMPRKYVLASDGKDVYRNFTISTPLKTSRFVHAVEFRPRNRRIVHHMALAVDSDGAARELEGADGQPGFGSMTTPDSVRRPEGFFVNWTPGTVPAIEPPGFAWKLEPGQDLVLQTHLKPTGKPEDMDAQIGLYFTDITPTKSAFVFPLSSPNILIPAGKSDYLLEDSFTLPVEVDLLAVLPHAHYLGKQLEIFAHLPDRSSRTLLRIPEWDFNWQDEFRYAHPVHLPAGTTLQLHYIYDNSDANHQNPNRPPKEVRYGTGSRDEMCDCRFQVVTANAADLKRLATASNEHQEQTIASNDQFQLGLDPHNALARTSIGLAQLSHGKKIEAIASFQTAIHDDPAYAAPHYYLGVTYRMQNRFVEARSEFETAIRLNPRNAKAYTNLGIVLVELGDFDKAEASFQQALRWNPTDRIASLALRELRTALANLRGGKE